MFSKKSIALTSLTIAGAALLVLTQTAGSPESGQPRRLQGAWLISAPGPVPDTAILFNAAFAPTDPSGNRATVYGSLMIRIPGELLDPDVPPMGQPGDYVGEAVMTGPNTAKFRIVGHAINKVTPSFDYPLFEKVAYVWVANGEMTFNGPDKIDMTFTLNDYPAGLDGFPAPGQPAFFTISAPANATRVGF